MQKTLASMTVAGLLDNLAEGIVITDSEGSVQYMNQAGLDLLGLSQQPASLYDVVAPYEAWQELLEANASAHLYRESGRVDVHTRPVTWNERPAWQLMFFGRQQSYQQEERESAPADYLAALSRVSQQLNLTLNLSNVLLAILQEAIDGIGAVGGEISLYDARRARFVPHLAQGQIAGLPENRQAEMARLRQIQVVLLASQSDRPQSQLVAPILYEGIAAGLMRLQHPEAAAFTNQAQLFVSTLAHHAAIAMGNARRFEELNKRNTQLHRRAQQIERFVESSRVLHNEVDLEQVFEDLVYAIQEGVGFRIVALNLIDKEDPAKILRTVTAAGMPLDRLAELRQIVQPWDTVAAVLLPEFAIASAYFIPSEHSEVSGELATYQVGDLYLPADRSQAEPIYRVVSVDQDGVLNVYDGPGTAHEHVATLTNGTTGLYITGPRAKSADGFWVPIAHKQTRGWVHERLLQEDTEPGALWDAEDLFFIPLYDSAREPIGLISLDSPIDGRRPDINVAKVLEIFANQASAAIENARLMSETLARSQELHTLFEASSTISSTLDQARILSVTGEHILHSVDGLSFTVYEWSRPKSEVMVVHDAHVDPELPIVPAGTIYRLNPQSSFSKVLTGGNPCVCRVVGDEPWLPKAPAWNNGATAYNLAWLPIMIRDEVFGLVEVTASPERREFSDNELQLMAAIMNQATIALENAQLFDDTARRERFFAALGRVSLAINAIFDLPTVLNLICQESLSLFDVDGAYIWQVQEQSLVGTAARGHAHDEFIGTVLPVDDPEQFAAVVAQQGIGTYRNSFADEVNLRLGLPQQESLRAVLGIPLTQENITIGVLILVDQRDSERFGPGDLEQATLFGLQAAIAIQNAQLFTELRELNEQLDQRVSERTRDLGQERDRGQYLLRVTTELSASLDQDRVLNLALELVNEVVHATQGSILLVDYERQRLIYRAAFGTPIRLPPNGFELALRPDEGLAGWIIKNRAAAIVHDTREDERWLVRSDGPDHRSVLAVPLESSGDVIGVLMLFHKEPGAFSQEQLELVEAAAIQVASAISNAQLYLLIRDQAERLGKMLREEQIEAAKNQAILESIADGVMVADANGRVILANLPASLILDIPRQQLLGKSVQELLGLFGSTAQSLARTFDQWSRHTATRQRAVLADRLAIEEKFVSVHLSPVFAGSQFFGTVSIFRDVTRDVEVDRMKSEFVSTVSHELRTPMTSVKGYADLMLMGAAGPMTEQQTRYLMVIKSNADRLSLLVNDLLDISRIETGKTQLELRPVDVPQLVQQVVEGHLHGRIEHDDKPIAVKTELAPALPLVQADFARVTQILTNLLDNAFHYTPAGGTITVSARANSSYVYISVTDTGIGIGREIQQKIFDRFFRAEDSEVQKVAGTGLGLAIVRSLVEMHGGQIEVFSIPGQGSTFTFNLPTVLEENDVL